MKLLSVETCTADYINGYIDDGRNYKSFQLTPDMPPTFGPPLPKKNYRDIAHFAGVIGKFDPYAFILAEPIEIEDFTFPSLRKTILASPHFHI